MLRCTLVMSGFAATLGGPGSGNSSIAMGGAPGAIYGTPTLEPLRLGSTGGDGSWLSRGGEAWSGGALQLVSGVSITVAGAIVMGQEKSWGTTGGSSGGSLLLEAPEVIINGFLDNGGGDADLTDFGGAGSTDGGPGMDGTPGEAGAGGGGAGYIRINTADGTADIAIDALLQPSKGSPCVSFGTLHPRSPPAMAECDAVAAALSECERCLGRHCCDELAACRGEELCGFCFDMPPSERGPGCYADSS